MTLSTYSENKLLDHLFGGVPYVRPPTVSLSLFTAAPNSAGSGGAVVPVGDGYPGPLVIANTPLVFPAAVNGFKKNSEALPIGTPSGAGWGQVVGIGMYDDMSNFMAYYPLDAPQNCTAGKFIDIPAGALKLRLSGSWANDFACAVLDHILGGPDYAPPEIWYYGLLAGSVELTNLGYVRSAVPNNTTSFSPAVSGVKTNGATLSFGPAGEDWPTADHYALYAQASGGVLSMSAVLPDTTVVFGDTAFFAAGIFNFSLH